MYRADEIRIVDPQCAARLDRLPDHMEQVVERDLEEELRVAGGQHALEQ